MSKRTLVYLLICCFCYGLMASTTSISDKAKTLTEYHAPTTDLKDIVGFKKAIVTDPIVTITMPADGAVLPIGTDLTVEANATDDGSIRNIRLFVNGTTIRKINGSSGVWGPPTDPELANLEAGTYELKVVAVDNQGNTGEAIHTVTVSGDVEPENIPPTVTITAPADGANFLEGDDVNVTVTASDSDGNVTGVELFLDNASQGAVTSEPYSWILSDLVAGSYMLKAVATDDEDATSEQVITITIIEDTGENIPPTVNFTNPNDGDTYTEGDDLSVTASASDLDGNVTGVEFIFDGNSQGTDDTAPYEWALQNLAIGTYDLQVIATDDDMATSQQTISITVEEIADDGIPKVTISTPADGETFPAGTDLTVEASATDSDGTIRNIRLLVNGATIRKINGSSGTWGPPNDPELANLEAGIYELRVVAIDNEGNRGETTHTITVSDDNGGENRPPSVSFTSPNDGAMFIVGNDIEVEADASDPDGTVSQIELFLDDASQGAETLAPYEWTLSNLAVGTYTLKVVATDNEGATDEESISITVKEDDGQNIPPTVSFTNPSDGDMFDQGEDLTVTANASDSDGSITQVELFANGDSQGTEALAPYEWNLQNLPSGSYELKLVATDDDGATAETTINITVKEDNTGDDGTPVVTISTPADGANFPVGTDLNVEASATDSDGTIRNIRLLVNGTTIRKINGATGTWGPPEDPELANLEAGTYELRVIAIDNRGNRGEKIHTITIGDDNGGENRPPIVDITSPSDGAMFFIGNNIQIEATASDSDGSISQLELFLNDVSQGAEVLAPYQWILEGLAVGSYTIRVVATDNDGATAEESISISIKEGDSSNGEPSVSFSNPSDGDMFDKGDDLIVEANASDSDGTITQVELFFNDDSQGTETLAPYEWDLQNLPVGTHELKLVATDNDGATAESMITITVKDNDPPADDGTPVVTISTPSDGANFPVGTDLNVEASATDSDGTIRNIRLLVNGTTIRKINGATGSWGPPEDPELADLEAGTYELQVVAVDNSGKRGEKTHTITISEDGGGDNFPPNIGFVSPDDGDSFMQGEDVEVEIATSDIDGTVASVELFVDDVSQGTLTTPPFEWTLSNLSVGTHELRARSTDDDGASRDAMVTISVERVDGLNVPPTVSFTNPSDGESFTEGDNLTVTAMASDSDGNVTGVEFIFDGNSQGTDNTAPYEWSLQNLAIGTYDLQVIATDDDMATAQQTISITVEEESVIGDGTPVVTISTPEDKELVPVGSDLVVEASATDDGSVRNVRLFFDGVFVRKINGSTGRWSVDDDPELADLSEGEHTVRVVAVDNQGNTGEMTRTIFASPISASFVQPMPNQVFSEGSDVVVEVSASTTDGRIRKVELFMNDAFVRTESVAPYEWGLETQSDEVLSNMTPGDYALVASVISNRGDTAEICTNFTVEASNIGLLANGIEGENIHDNNQKGNKIESRGNEKMMNIPPVTTIHSPTDGQTFIAGTDLTVTASATDEDGRVRNIRLYFDDDFVRKINGDTGEWNGDSDPELANLQVGEHTIRVGAVDNGGASSEVIITINVVDDGENVPPTVSFLEPTDGQTFPEGTDLNVEVAASDSDGSITGVDLYINDNFVRNESLPPYIWGSATPNTDLPLQDLPAGMHELKAIATDNEGATTTETIMIIVEGEDDGGGDNGGGDNGGGGHTDDDQTVGGEDGTPITTIVSPRDGDVFPVGSDLTVVAEASDPDGRVRNVRMYLNEAFISKINSAPYEWTADEHSELANLQEGSYDIRVGSVDNSGKSSELTITITVSDEVPNDPPGVSFDAPLDGAEVTTGDDVIVEVSASDNDGTVTGVEFFLDDALISNDDTAPYEWTIGAISEGAHTLKAIATDNDGATSETSISITATTEQDNNTPPTVSFTTPSDGDSFTEGDNLNVIATASDEDGSVSQVEFFFDNTSQGTDDEAPYEWTYEGLVAGDYDLKVVATDDEGATAELTISITVNEDMSGGDNFAPSIGFVSPVDGATFMTGDDIEVNIATSDIDGNVASVELFVNNDSQGTVTTSPYSWTLSGLAAGTYSLKAISTDDDNASSEATISITVEGEVSENTPPTVSFSTPNDGDNFTEGDDLSVTVTASDSDGSVVDVELYYDDNLVGSDEDDPYTWMILNLTEGTHTLRAKATDDDGAEAEMSISITVEAENTGGGSQTAGGENGTPITTILSPTDGDVLPVGSDLRVIAEASDPDGRVRNVRMYLNENFISKINNPPYEWSGDEHPELANLQEGSYDIRVGSVDNSGKSSEVIITITVGDGGGGNNGGGDNGGGGTDEIDPIVSFDRPFDGQIFEEGDDILVTAAASDEDGTISKVDLYLDGVFVRTEVNAPYDWGDQPGQDTELENMQPGMYDLRVVATDNDGNTDSETITITVNAEDNGGGNNGGGGSSEGAQISIENRTKLPILETSFPADDIYSFCHVNKPAQTMTDEHNRNTMRIHSTGTTNLVISQINISDTSEYTLPNNDWDQLPITIPPGQSHDLLIQFVESRGNRGFRGQTIELVTNDEDNPTVRAELRGAYHPRPEGNNEPHVRTIIQTLGFKTDLGDRLNTGLYPDPAEVETGIHGDLVLSEVWERADPNEPVIGVNLAVYKGGGQTLGSGLNTRFVNVDNLEKVGNFNFNTCSGFHQSILAKNQNCRSYDLIAGIERDQVDVPFRIVMDGYISDGKGDRDPVTGRRHLLAIRMFKVIDHDGNEIPNHYIAINDYVKNGCSEADGAGPDDEFANCDWNDNIAYFINIKPVNPLAIGNMSIEEVEQRFGKIARQKELRAYPNPTQQELNVDLTSFMDEEVNLIIQDQIGKVVQFQEFDHNHSMIENLDLGQLNPGFYILTLQSGDVQLTKKIIVNQQ